MTLRLYRQRTAPLGDLERAVLDGLWTQGAATAQWVMDALAPTHAINLSTVQTTVERLVRKGLLQRQKAGRAFVYRPVISREALTSRMVAELVQSLSQPQGAASVGAVDLAQAVDESTLQTLEDWVATTRRRRDAISGGSPESDG